MVKLICSPEGLPGVVEDHGPAESVGQHGPTLVGQEVSGKVKEPCQLNGINPAPLEGQGGGLEALAGTVG